MRVDVKKHLIFGPWSVRSAFFAEAQRSGVAEFISPRAEPLENPPEIQTYLEALHVLRALPPVKQILPYDFRSSIVFATHIVERKEAIEQMQEKVLYLEKEIARIEGFGEFSLSDVRNTEAATGRIIQYFFAKKIENLEAIKRPEVIVINCLHGLYYFITINKEKASYEGLFEMKIERSLDDLRGELALLRNRINHFEDELSSLAHHKKQLQKGLTDALNHYHLSQSKDRVEEYLEGTLFTVEAWIPKNKMQLFHDLCIKMQCILEPIQIEEKDRVPTYLENRAVGKIGEDLVSIYDTPSNKDKDPSLWIFFSFALFFSMIIADLGYGLILLAIALFLLRKFRKKTGFGKRVLKLTLYLSIGCIIWGIMLPSFVGLNIPPQSKWREFSLVTWMIKEKAAYNLKHKGTTYEETVKEYPELKNAKTAMQFLTMVKKKEHQKITYPVFDAYQGNVLIEIALIIGAIHIMLSFLRYADKHWAGIGWAIFIIGGYLYFPSVIQAQSLVQYIFKVPEKIGAEVGFIMIWVGLGLAAVLALIQQRLAGLAELTQVVNVFAGIMSYLRIYALALAGIVMAETFNDIAAGLPIYFAVLVILAGHTVNFGFALMGGLINGLRLNFVEWYHYSFEGGGRPFKPLSLLKIE